MTLKWQPWISRFHLPMFVLAMPLVAAVIERFFSRRDKAPSGILAGIVIVAFLCALHPLFFNNTRRIFGNGSIFLYPREHLYFVKKFPLAPVVGQAVWALNIKGCRDVGLKLGADDWEYPWQVFLGKAVRVEHVGVNNATAAFMYPGGEFHPCEVIDMVSVKR